MSRSNAARQCRTGTRRENLRGLGWRGVLAALFLMGLLIVPFASAQKKEAKSSSAKIPPNVLLSVEMAIDDGFPGLAIERLSELRRAPLEGDDEWEVALLEVKAKLRSKKAEDALVQINTWAGRPGMEKRGPAFGFWKAQAEYALEEEANALKTVGEIGRLLPSHPMFHPILRLRSRLLVKAGEIKTAAKAFTPYMEDFEAWKESHPETLLDAAAVGVLSNDPALATNALSRLTAATGGGTSSQLAAIWMAEWEFAAGKSDEAIKRLDTVGLDEAADLDLRIQALRRRAEWQAETKDLTGSEEALRLARKLEPRTDERTRLSLYQAKILLAMKNPEVGVPLLREAIGTLADEAEASRATLDMAEYYMAEQEFDSAKRAYDAHLRSFSDPVAKADAWMGKGLCVFQQKQFAEAAELFQRVVDLKEAKPQQREEAIYMLADAHFAAEDFPVARKAYLDFARAFSGHKWEARAKFQAALCLNRDGKAQEGETELRVQAKFYPEIAEKAMFEIAQSLQERRRWPQAITAYDEYIKDFTNGMYLAEAYLKRGLCMYRMGDFEAADLAFAEVHRAVPLSPIAERAAYMRGWAKYMRGDEKAAQNEFGMFMEAYPESGWTQDVLFWLGERQFNRGEFASAESNFVDVANLFPDGRLVDQSLFWAGRAAMAMDQFRKAIDHFAKVPVVRPDSPLVPESLFKRGDALTVLGDFEGAKSILQKLIRNHPESYLLPQAWARIGDCYHAKPPGVAPDVKEEEKDGLQPALDAYRDAVRARGESHATKLWAEYQIGKILAGRNETEAAIASYTRGVYRYEAARDRLDATSRLWFVQSAYGAAGLLEREGDLKRAINMYQRVVDARGVEAEDAQAKLTKLELEQFLNRRRVEPTPR